jgi:murein endopeptidase
VNCSQRGNLRLHFSIGKWNTRMNIAAFVTGSFGKGCLLGAWPLHFFTGGYYQVLQELMGQQYL